MSIDWVEGDAEELPFPDDSFDAVLSAFGCMFAPRQEVVADELARVLRPSGRLGVCAWTPEGSIGEFFRVVGGYLPPSPSYVDPPLAWGSEDSVRELFEGTGIALDFSREVCVLHHASPADAVECYATMFGPVVLAREALGDRWPELRDDLVELFERHYTTQVLMPAEYLVIRVSGEPAARRSWGGGRTRRRRSCRPVVARRVRRTPRGFAGAGRRR